MIKKLQESKRQREKIRNLKTKKKTKKYQKNWKTVRAREQIWRSCYK